MSRLIPITRNGEGWQDYCRIAGRTFKASPESDDPWDPNKQPDEPRIKHFLYADDTDQIIGILSMRHTDHDFAYVNNVAIDPSAQRQKNGLRMMHEFERVVSDRYDGAWLHCAQKNILFYSTIGYGITPDKPNCPANVTMAKRFTPKEP